MYTDLISICIPTYNGAHKLEQSLEAMVPYLLRLGPKIVISDNASSDNTAAVVARFRAQYPYIAYFRNDENIGADRNFERVLKLADTKYCWLLGDDDYISESAMERVFSELSNEDYSAAFVNPCRMSENLPSTVLYGGHQVLSEVGATATFISLLIFKRELLDTVDFSKYYDCQYLHTGVFYETVAGDDTRVLHVRQPSVFYVGSNSLTWGNRLLQLIIKRIYELPLLFVPYYTEADHKLFWRFAFNTDGSGIYKYYTVLSRIYKELNFELARSMKKEFIAVAGRKNYLFALLVSIMPIKWLGRAYKTYRKLRGKPEQNK